MKDVCLRTIIIHMNRYFQCCACYGPKGGTDNYCLKNCSAVNGGKITKQVVTWIWIRSSLPKRVWRKCIDFTITNKHGKEEKYRLDEETGLREKVGKILCNSIQKCPANHQRLITRSKMRITIKNYSVYTNFVVELSTSMTPLFQDKDQFQHSLFNYRSLGQNALTIKSPHVNIIQPFMIVCSGKLWDIRGNQEERGGETKLMLNFIS